MFSRKFLSGVALTALSFGMGAGVAHAQSTASQEEDVIIVTGQRQSVNGVMTAEQAAKARSTITSDFIDQQAAGQSILNTINLVPGVNFTNNDAYGTSGGNLVMRGFDGARISLTFDGIPLNDTGNYAIFSNQQMDPELISRANVNMGTTDVDSPTASATGGTVNYVTRLPGDEMGVTLVGSAGSDNYNRIFGLLDTGTMFWNTGAWLSASHQQYDQFIGPGELEKTQYNARVYHDMGGGDFISLGFHYNENRNAFYRTFNLATFNSGIWPVNDATCTRLVAGAGTQNENGLCTNFFGVRINPSDTGNIRGQSRFSFGDALTFTFDPSLQYVRANGGGIEAVFENDVRLRNAANTGGTDLNGDSDTVDRINLYSPSNTNTYRYGANTSLIWDINDSQRVRVGYTWDYGRHRQTGEYSLLGADGHPAEVFGGRDGFGTPVLTLQGDVFQKRNRFSIAALNQVSVEYRGDFMNDNLTIVAGARAPRFERELDQNCYAVKGSTSSTQFCTARTPTVLGSGFVRFDLNGDGDLLDTGENTEYAPPFESNVSYDAILPNLGVTLRPGEGHQIFFSYSEGLSAPRTDDLYGGILVSQLSTVEPERTKAYDFGYRYQTDWMVASATLWFNQFENRIIRSQDPLDPTVSFSRNVGAVDLWGLDGQIGIQPSDALTLYLSAALTNSELKNNLPGQVVGAGNQLVETPEWTLAARGEYEVGPFTLGLQAKMVDRRFSNDFNTEVAPSYSLVDFDARVELPWVNEQTYLQLNIVNLLDEEYISTISSGANGGTGFFGVGAPQTTMLTLRTGF